MNDRTTVIYRHPDHAGRKPVTKIVQRGDMPMLTLDPHRLARAGSVQSIIVRRRVRVRVVVGFLLVVALLVVALAAASRVRAQTFEVGAPCLKCVYLPEVQR